MSYVELYKKYRPVNWDGIVGQDAVVSSLRKAVIEDKIPGGFLFAGKQHGCGKTSAAIVMAKALNCENLDKATGNPCNECETCKNIEEKRQIGVNYISLANNSSIDSVRDILEQANLAQPIKKQVWILDECHRISPAAFDLFLIPLEKENLETLFIFCSTEPEKIPDTVKSRLQVRNFRKIELSDVADRLTTINLNENLNLTAAQILEAARAGNGSLREAIGFLEIVAADGKLTASHRGKLLNVIGKKDFVGLLKLTGEIEAEGQDFAKVAEALFRDLSDMLLTYSGAIKPEDAQKGFLEFAKAVGPSSILRSLDILGDTLNKMAMNVIDKRILFEVALTKIIQVIIKAGGK